MPHDNKPKVQKSGNPRPSRALTRDPRPTNNSVESSVALPEVVASGAIASQPLPVPKVAAGGSNTGGSNAGGSNAGSNAGSNTGGSNAGSNAGSNTGSNTGGVPTARYDRPGHLADEHAQRLLALSKRRRPDDVAFLVANKGNTDDDLAEELAEQAVSAMTTGGDTWMEFMDKTVEEEEGGPFIETRASREFARGPEQEVDGFLREALPTTRNGVKSRAQKRR